MQTAEQAGHMAGVDRPLFNGSQGLSTNTSPFQGRSTDLNMFLQSDTPDQTAGKGMQNPRSMSFDERLQPYRALSASPISASWQLVELQQALQQQRARVRQLSSRVSPARANSLVDPPTNSIAQGSSDTLSMRSRGISETFAPLRQGRQTPALQIRPPTLSIPAQRQPANPQYPPQTTWAQEPQHVLSVVEARETPVAFSRSGLPETWVPVLPDALPSLQDSPMSTYTLPPPQPATSPHPPVHLRISVDERPPDSPAHATIQVSPRAALKAPAIVDPDEPELGKHDVFTRVAVLLPSGSILAFLLLANITTGAGQYNKGDKGATAVFVVLSAVLCALLSLTDEVHDVEGGSHYILRLPGGCIAFYAPLYLRLRRDPAHAARTYDFLHSAIATSVFLSVVLLSPPVSLCLFPGNSPGTSNISPIWSMFFPLLVTTIAIVAAVLVEAPLRAPIGFGGCKRARPTAATSSGAPSGASGPPGPAPRLSQVQPATGTAEAEPVPAADSGQQGPLGQGSLSGASLGMTLGNVGPRWSSNQAFSTTAQQSPGESSAGSPGAPGRSHDRARFGALSTTPERPTLREMLRSGSRRSPAEQWDATSGTPPSTSSNFPDIPAPLRPSRSLSVRFAEAQAYASANASAAYPSEAGTGDTLQLVPHNNMALVSPSSIPRPLLGTRGTQLHLTPLHQQRPFIQDAEPEEDHEEDNMSAMQTDPVADELPRFAASAFMDSMFRGQRSDSGSSKGREPGKVVQSVVLPPAAMLGASAAGGPMPSAAEGSAGYESAAIMSAQHSSSSEAASPTLELTLPRPTRTESVHGGENEALTATAAAPSLGVRRGARTESSTHGTGSAEEVETTDMPTSISTERMVGRSGMETWSAASALGESRPRESNGTAAPSGLGGAAVHKHLPAGFYGRSTSAGTATGAWARARGSAATAHEAAQQHSAGGGADGSGPQSSGSGLFSRLQRRVQSVDLAPMSDGRVAGSGKQQVEGGSGSRTHTGKWRSAHETRWR